MTTIGILRESEIRSESSLFCAVAYADNAQAVGKTPGEALDALIAQIGSEASSGLVLVQQMQPDRFFNMEQQQRLQVLMARSQEAQAAGRELPLEEESERNALIAAELLASAQRTAALADALGK